jgi:hypothetical protein
MANIKLPMNKGRQNAGERQGLKFSTIFLVLTNLLVFQFGYLRGRQTSETIDVVTEMDVSASSLLSTTTSSASQVVVEPRHQIVYITNSSLSIPIGDAVALPSIRIQQNESAAARDQYGGQGDKPHLGGFTEVDMHGLTPSAWLWMVTEVGVKSVLDVGCGRGISTSWFAIHGVDAQCVEGSHDAYEKSMLPNKETRMVEHDFSRGPWWPTRTVDAVWCVEFLEHVRTTETSSSASFVPG